MTNDVEADGEFALIKEENPEVGHGQLFYCLKNLFLTVKRMREVITSVLEGGNGYSHIHRT